MPSTWPAARAAVARHLDRARFDDVGCRTLLLGLLLSLRDEIVEVRSPGDRDAAPGPLSACAPSELMAAKEPE
jgi:hypothetical protein